MNIPKELLIQTETQYLSSTAMEGAMSGIFLRLLGLPLIQILMPVKSNSSVRTQPTASFTNGVEPNVNRFIVALFPSPEQ